MKHCVKFLVMDVDGTLTDGKIYMYPTGEAMKAFNIKDGCGIVKVLPKLGITPVIITARESKILENRCKELHITEIHQGSQDKLKTLQDILSKSKESMDTVAYIGDDLPDMAVMQAIKEAGGFVLCPADAIQEIKDMANYESSYRAGDGAIRDCIENFLSISNTSSLGGQAEQTSQTSQTVRNQGAENIEASGTTRSAIHTETSEVAEAAGIELSPSASLLLDCLKEEYSKERERMQNLDNKAAAFMSALILILTVFVPIIPFDKFYSVFAGKIAKNISDVRQGIVAISISVLMASIGAIVEAFYQLYKAYRPKAIMRFEIDNIDFIKQPVDIIEPALCGHYKEIIEKNIKSNDEKVDKINLGLTLASCGFLVLAVTSIVIRICIGD